MTDMELQALQLEREAQELRRQALRQTRAREQQRRDEFERQHGSLRISDDYAVMKVADWKFYYGYEYTVPEYLEPDEIGEWAFVAWHQGEEVCRLARSEVYWDVTEEPSVLLLAGVLRLFSDDMIDRVERDDDR